MEEQAIFIPGKDTDTALLCIHGIMGSPSYFTWLFPEAQGRAAIYSMLLPGHGGTTRDFCASRMAQWQAAARQAVERLSGEYQRLLIAGYSLGGLLAIQSALASPDRVKGLFLIDTPLCLRMEPPTLRNNFRVAMEGLLEDPTRPVSLGTVLRNAGVFPRYMELLRESRRLRNRVAGLRCPVWAVQARQDALVSLCSLSCFSALPRAELLCLSHSTHDTMSPEDRRLALDSFSSFLRAMVPRLEENTLPI